MGKKTKILNSTIGVGKITGFVIAILIIGLSIVALPSDVIRQPVNDNDATDERKNFILGQDVFFYGFFGPLFLSGVLVVVLLFTNLKLRILEASFHFLIALAAFGLSGFLLFVIVTEYNLLIDQPFCPTFIIEPETSPMPELETDIPFDIIQGCVNDHQPKKSESEEQTERRIKNICSCIMRTFLKSESSFGAGSLGILYGLLNFALSGMTIFLKLKRARRMEKQNRQLKIDEEKF